MEFAQMIILDTHIWIWWINNEFQLLTPKRHTVALAASSLGIIQFQA